MGSDPADPSSGPSDLHRAAGLPRRAGSTGPTDPVEAGITVSAETIRNALHLTPHQLGEYTKHLGLAIGDRPNYPRYGPTQVHLLVAVQALRDLQVPFGDACQAVRAIRQTIGDSNGWIVLYPTDECWVAAPAPVAATLTSLLALTARAVVVDVTALRTRAQTAWRMLATATPH